MEMDTTDLEALMGKCLKDFYDRRLQKLNKLKLRTFLRRKNPYLFRALGIQKAPEIIERVLSDYLGASDETIFGDAFFEPIARIVSKSTVSDGAGVDFTIETKQRITAIAMKSGPNPFNSSAKRRQSQEFLALRNRLYKIQKQFDAVLGHGYGRSKSKPTSERVYRDSSGQAFWTEITGDPDFYLKLIRLMKDAPAIHKKEYTLSWDAAINRFTAEFVIDFCFKDGTIDWEKLVQFVSEDKSKLTK